MKKKLMALCVAVLVVFGFTSCSVPILDDFIVSEESLGKTNNTAATIGDAMKDYLALQEMEDCALYGIDMQLNSDANGYLKFYYCQTPPVDAEYSHIWVAEVNSKTAHVERFSKLNRELDGEDPYYMVKENDCFDAGSLPVDSDNAISFGIRSFSNDLEFQYDYVQMQLTAPNRKPVYEIRFISMLNDLVYCCTVDAVGGNVLAQAQEALEQEDII